MENIFLGERMIYIERVDGLRCHLRVEGAEFKVSQQEDLGVKFVLARRTRAFVLEHVLLERVRVAQVFVALWTHGGALVHRKVSDARAFVHEAGIAQAAQIFAVQRNYVQLSFFRQI
jgi:hypothetical protein